MGKKVKQYDVQVKAIKPNKVVTIGRFITLKRAQEVRDQLTAIGFEVIVSWKRDKDED
jgi:hypothetical protein